MVNESEYLEDCARETLFDALEHTNDINACMNAALGRGYRPSPQDVMDLLEDWDYDDAAKLVQASQGIYSAKDAQRLIELYLPESAQTWFVGHVLEQGMAFTDRQIAEIADAADDPQVTDMLVNNRIDRKGPFTLDEINPPIGVTSPIEYCSAATTTRVIQEAPGRFTWDEVTRFADYHLGGSVDDALLEALASKTDCAPAQRNELLFSNGFTAEEDPLLTPPKKERVSFLDMLGAIFLGKAVGEIIVGSESKGSALPEPRFHDYNNAWGSTNDHNWEADGDVRWDSFDW